MQYRIEFSRTDLYNLYFALDHIPHSKTNVVTDMRDAFATFYNNNGNVSNICLVLSRLEINLVKQAVDASNHISDQDKLDFTKKYDIIVLKKKPRAIDVANGYLERINATAVQVWDSIKYNSTRSLW